MPFCAYQYSCRDAKLLEWLRKLQIRYHSPSNFNRYEMCITNGSMEGLSKVFELLLNPEDPILIDSPCYSGSLDFVSHLNESKSFLYSACYDSSYAVLVLI